MKEQPHQDIKQNSWILRKSPKGLRPYILLTRIDRPIGIFLLLLPALWSFALTFALTDAPFTAHTAWILALFATGAITMRAAGCIINDLWDKKLDTHISRTASRPLACGALSIHAALLTLLCLLLISLLILLQLPHLTQTLGLISIPLITIYPLMKRITWWPQLVLGLTFNLSALMGWSALTGTLSAPPLWLYGSCILWTLAYDTIYAHQDRDEDALIGIKSTARLFGHHSPTFVYICYGVSLALCALATGPAKAISLVPAGVYALYLCKMWDPNSQDSALHTFKRSVYYGLLVLAGLLT